MPDIHYEFSAVCLPPGTVAPGMALPVSGQEIPPQETPPRAAPGKVAIFVTVKGLSPSDIAAYANVIRRDVLQCFKDSGFDEVADILNGLPYQWAGSDTLTFHGAVLLRRHIFCLLSLHRSDLDDPHRTGVICRDPIPGPHPDSSSGANSQSVTGHGGPTDETRSVSVEFFRSQSPPYLTVHLHHGAVQSWVVSDTPPPPVLCAPKTDPSETGTPSPKGTSARSRKKMQKEEV